MVDDRPENLMALEAILACPEYNLVRARSGAEALRHVLEDDFAVVLLDAQMPEMDGYQTAKVIHQLERARATPIIFITAMDADESLVHRGYQAGAIDYILKPFDTFVLKSKVSAFVDLFRSKRSIG